MIKLNKASLSFPGLDLPEVKKNLLHWAMQFPLLCALDNCGQDTDRYGNYEWLLGVAREPKRIFRNWRELEDFKGSWLMGILPYGLKDQFEKHIYTSKEAAIDFPSLPLFEPEILIGISRGDKEVKVLQGEVVEEAFEALPPPPPKQIFEFEPNFSRRTYIETVQELRRHIKEGDTYEINLAQAFTAHGHLPQPQHWFHRLTQLSPVPFAAFFRWEDQYLLCASPERFLQLKDKKLRSQPIKGTAARHSDPEKDQAFYDYLRHSHKEQAENVMIVDLTRHDLYKSCIPHSVEVPYLFEIQAFPQVYQMVSTIEGQVDPKLHWQQVLAQTFPPGSMTGAPKVKSMELIDRYEPLSRGVYAGSVGYVQPNGDFDWNVIIRSLLYDDAREKLSYHVGGAITYDSDPEQEYEETLLKASALRRVFG